MLNLETDAPQTGIGADCYNVAQTALYLETRAPEGSASFYGTARHAVTLHRISGQLHRIAERQCCEDLTCRACDGRGEVRDQQPKTGTPCGCKRGVERDNCPACEGTGSRIDFAAVRAGNATKKCPACAGTGSTLGRKEARLIEGARQIATHYGLTIYHQTDPRGCSLYLIDPADVPTKLEDLTFLLYTNERDKEPLPDRDALRRRWISSNYNHGHAVVRVGR